MNNFLKTLVKKTTFLAVGICSVCLSYGQEDLNIPTPQETGSTSPNRPKIPNFEELLPQNGNNKSDNPERGESLFKGNELLKSFVAFSYSASERDPFVSYTVVSPFVTEEALPEIVGEDTRKQAQEIKDAMETAIKSQIKIIGISTGKNKGTGFAMLKGGQIVRPGEYTIIPLAEDVQAKFIEGLNQIASLDIMPKIEPKPNGPQIELLPTHIEERWVHFKSPIILGDEKPGEIIVTYEKSLKGISKKRTTSETP